MITRVLNPLVSAVLGVLLSVAVGLSLSWRTLNVLVDQTIQQRLHREPTELQKKGWDFWTVAMSNLSTEVTENREILKKRAEELDQREERVKAAEKELEKARTDIDALRKEISNRVIEISADEMTNLKKLAQTYANLTPRAVVAIIREMDDATAVKILSLMKPDVVGPIFEEMSKMSGGADGSLARRAAVLSEKLRLMKASKPSTPP